MSQNLIILEKDLNQKAHSHELIEMETIAPKKKTKKNKNKKKKRKLG